MRNRVRALSVSEDLPGNSRGTKERDWDLDYVGNGGV